MAGPAPRAPPRRRPRARTRRPLRRTGTGTTAHLWPTTGGRPGRPIPLPSQPARCRPRRPTSGGNWRMPRSRASLNPMPPEAGYERPGSATVATRAQRMAAGRTLDARSSDLETSTASQAGRPGLAAAALDPSCRRRRAPTGCGQLRDAAVARRAAAVDLATDSSQLPCHHVDLLRGVGSSDHHGADLDSSGQYQDAGSVVMDLSGVVRLCLTALA